MWFPKRKRPIVDIFLLSKLKGSQSEKLLNIQKNKESKTAFKGRVSVRVRVKFSKNLLPLNADQKSFKVVRLILTRCTKTTKVSVK